MTDHIIKAAKELGVHEYGPRSRNWSFDLSQLERFYAIAFAQGMERAAEICDDMVLYTGYDCATAIRAESHAQNQPKNVHDTGNVSKN